MNSNRTLGKYLRAKGHFVFNYNDLTGDQVDAVQFHEAVHSQLAHTTQYGAFINYLTLFNEKTSKKYLYKLTRRFLEILTQNDLFVHEAIATFCYLTFLSFKEERALVDYKKYISKEYYKYIHPFEIEIKNKILNLDYIDGAINIGLMSLNSPIIEMFSEISNVLYNVENISHFLELINSDQINPTRRFNLIVEQLRACKLEICDIVPERKLNQFEDLLTQDGLIITNRDLKTKDELKNYNYSCLAKLLNSRLFAKDKIVRKFFLNNVGFLEDSGLLEKQMDNTATVLHRDFGKSHNNDFNIEEVLEILYRNKSIEEHEGIVPILEIRSEDVFFNNIEKISFQLPHTNIFINFTPVPGNCEYFISMIAEKQRVKNLINRFFKENNGRVLISSNFFNYQTHSHLEYNYIPNSSVIIGVGSSLIVSKLGTILTSALDHEFYNLKISDDSSIEYILIRHYNEFFNYYSILPAASYNVIMFSDILNNYGVQRANTNRLFRHIEYIEPVIFHLDSLGWTPENQIDNESIEHIIYDYNKK